LKAGEVVFIQTITMSGRKPWGSSLTSWLGASRITKSQFGLRDHGPSEALEGAILAPWAADGR